MSRYADLFAELSSQFELGSFSVHGPAHWSRVEKYGLFLACSVGADLEVVRLFAHFHDCRRVSEDRDPGHGLRGAEYARSLHERLHLDEERFETLFQACGGHTDQIFSHDPSIACCWDADRLDLDRIGVEPEPDFLSTSKGKELAVMAPEARRRLVGIPV